MGNGGSKQHYETASKTGVLQLSDHNLKEMPSDVFSLCEILRNLDVSKNKIATLPENISKFKMLKILNLCTNKLEALPSSFGDLKKLETLNLSNNLIRSLPHSFTKLENLKHVYLNNNKLREFPSELIGLPNLEVVELSKNKIIEIPNGMAKFYAAELNISQNEISKISEDLHEAPKLKILRLEENCLSLDAIMPSLLRDSKIHTLAIDGNLFESKQLASVEGYNEYTERYTAIKKKMF